MNKVKYISAVILLGAATLAHAETAATLPGDKGLASVNKNLAADKNTDNKGLQNASEQLKKNQVKHAEQAEKRSEKHETNMEKKTERVETRAVHHETMDHPAKVERPGK